jgi:hypothetical protein
MINPPCAVDLPKGFDLSEFSQISRYIKKITNSDIGEF